MTQNQSNFVSYSNVYMSLRKIEEKWRQQCSICQYKYFSYWYVKTKKNKNMTSISNNKPIIALDCDGVLLDYPANFARIYEKTFGKQTTLVEPRSYYVSSIAKNKKQRERGECCSKLLMVGLFFVLSSQWKKEPLHQLPSLPPHPTCLQYMKFLQIFA